MYFCPLYFTYFPQSLFYINEENITKRRKKEHKIIDFPFSSSSFFHFFIATCEPKKKGNKIFCTFSPNFGFKVIWYENGKVFVAQLRLKLRWTNNLSAKQTTSNVLFPFELLVYDQQRWNDCRMKSHLRNLIKSYVSRRLNPQPRNGIKFHRKSTENIKTSTTFNFNGFGENFSIRNASAFPVSLLSGLVSFKDLFNC